MVQSTTGREIKRLEESAPREGTSVSKGRESCVTAKGVFGWFKVFA
jgi:hypothetical protein